MKHYLLFDLGTGNTRVAIVTSEGTIVDIRTITNYYLKDDAYEDAQYFLPAEWEEKMLQAAKDLLHAHPDIVIDAVSSAAARQTVILVDEEGKAFYALPNIDNRGREYMEEIGHAKEIYEISGKWATEDFCAAKLYGLSKKRPEIYGKIHRILSESEWIAHLLTGSCVCEPTQACEMQLYDIRAKEWSDELLSLYHVDRSVLPALVPAGTAFPILAEWKEALHLSPEAVFIVGGADTQIGALQTGAGSGDIVIVSGTTTPVLTYSEQIFHDEKERVWVDMGLGGENYVTEMNPGVTGLNYQRIKDGLLSHISYSDLEKAYTEKTSFTSVASFSSLLFYEKRSLRRGGFLIPSPLRSDTDPVDMGYAVLADIACSVWEQLYRLRDITGTELSVLRGCGGGFRSGTLCQMIADLSGCTLSLTDGFEQATVQGLVQIINGALQEKSESAGQKIYTFSPRTDALIHRYHPVWLEYRNTIN
ncbi:MAG: carbohydrate kinase [Lachnospiraceae bacterium]|nr:carbohydrate kinase [Lachnospiraceae bacterium]